ncbi:MAG: hypothetical protein KME21_07010 [Desmonostoc vinosum HA7617-LM4]|nr:hypothetical protein [Desmonostoc vinosum HA7617-LM4]
MRSPQSDQIPDFLEKSGILVDCELICSDRLHFTIGDRIYSTCRFCSLG